MIRAYRPEDVEAVLDVWAAASALAHPFLAEAFLASERSAIRAEHLPRAETWVWEEEGRVVGFVALVGSEPGAEGAEVGALFVEPSRHRRGIGRALLEHARRLRGALEVEVFRDNALGRAFYDGVGFVPHGTSLHAPSGRELLRLRLAAPG